MLPPMSTRNNDTDLSMTYNICDEATLPVGKEIPVRLYTMSGEKEFLCDTETDGGGWIIFQIRRKGNTSFNRDWQTYKDGFGAIDTDYWLGNEMIHTLTSWGANYELLIEMTYRDQNFFARYGQFRVASEAQNYRLLVNNFAGNVENVFRIHNIMSFSTPDRDHDIHPNKNCAAWFSSGWWFAGCHLVNLNGLYIPKEDLTGIVWVSGDVMPSHKSLGVVMMKTRRRVSKLGDNE